MEEEEEEERDKNGNQRMRDVETVRQGTKWRGIDGEWRKTQETELRLNRKIQKGNVEKRSES